MASVKCTAPHGVSLPSGRRLPFGATIGNVDLADPDVMGLLDAGLLVPARSFDVTTAKVDDVMSWVDDDPGRAAAALATERARPEREQRSTLIGQLEQLVDTTTDDSPEED